MCVCVCVCVRAHARARVCVCVCVCVYYCFPVRSGGQGNTAKKTVGRPPVRRGASEILTGPADNDCQPLWATTSMASVSRYHNSALMYRLNKLFVAKMVWKKVQRTLDAQTTYEAATYYAQWSRGKRYVSRPARCSSIAATDLANEIFLEQVSFKCFSACTCAYILYYKRCAHSFSTPLYPVLIY